MKHLTLIALLIAAATPAHASTNRQVEAGELVLKNLGSDPSSPASGKVTIFSRSSTGKQYKKDSSGNVSQIGGAGGGGVNFIGQTTTWSPDNTDDQNLDTSVGTWLAFKDAAASIPVDLTGGSPTVTCTRSTSDPLDGTASLLMTFPASNTQGEGCEVNFNVQPAYQGRNVTISASLGVVSGSIVSGDIGVWVYNVTKSGLIQAQSGASACSIMGQDFTCTFPTTARDATPVNHAYRLGFYRQVSTATAVTIKGDNFKISPETTPQGMAGSDLQAYTPTFTGFGTVTNVSFFWRQVGDSYEIIGKGTTGTCTATEARISLPNNGTADSVKVPSIRPVGTFDRAANAAWTGLAALAESGVSYLTVGYRAGGTAAGSGPFTKLNASTLIGNTEDFAIHVMVPISGRSSNVQMSESAEFKISSYLANGTRVTSAPTKLGEYRAYKRSGASAHTVADDAPTVGPSATDGMLIYGNVPYNSAGTSGQPIKWEIFAGVGKYIQWEFHSAAGRTGYLSVDYHTNQGTTDSGAHYGYDPKTGIATIDAGYVWSSSNTSRSLGAAIATGTSASASASSGYFDFTVSNHPFPQGIGAVDSEIYLDDYAGYGATNTKIPYFTNVQVNKGTALTLTTNNSTSGASVTVNEAGLYTVNFSMDAAGSVVVAVSVDTPTPSASASSLTYANGRRAYSDGPSGSGSAFCSWTGRLNPGQVIRPHTDGTAATANATRQFFQVVKVSN
jgi:hypothetical protein